jgi:alkaline phosphatase D
VIKFNRKTRKITMECWPRNVDITDPATKQYLGWPKTVTQEDNYGRKPVAYLPTLKIAGDANPVVQIIDESDESIVYTLRINGNSFRPKVFKEGKYTIKVTHGEKSKTLKGVKSVGLKGSDTLDVKL